MLVLRSTAHVCSRTSLTRQGAIHVNGIGDGPNQFTQVFVRRYVFRCSGSSLPLPSAVTRPRAEPPFPYLRWLVSQRQAGRLWTGRPAFFLGVLAPACRAPA